MHEPAQTSPPVPGATDRARARSVVVLFADRGHDGESDTEGAPNLS